MSFVAAADYNNMGKFLNRILGMEVQQQNAVFQYFSDTLAAVIQEAKKSGRYDMGILGKTHVILHFQKQNWGRRHLIFLIIQSAFCSEKFLKAISSVCPEGWISVMFKYLPVLFFFFRSGLRWWESEEGRLQEISDTGLHYCWTCGTIHRMYTC